MGKRQRTAGIALLAVWAGLGWAASGCGRGSVGNRGAATHGTATVGGRVVSTVDGHAITVDELEQVVRETGLDSRAALARLQAERLLMAEAERRGFAGDPEVLLVAKQSRAQALLASTADAVTVSDEEIRAAYEKQRARFEPPERRASVHVLAQLPPEPTPEAEAAAKAFAAEMIPRLERATDPTAVLDEANAVQRPEFKVTAQVLPVVDRKANFVKPFLDALFSIAEPGVIREPVRTQFGWHAILVTEIAREPAMPYAEAARVLREELLLERRTQAVADLIARARAEHPVELSPGATDALRTLGEP